MIRKRSIVKKDGMVQKKRPMCKNKRKIIKKSINVCEEIPKNSYVEVEDNINSELDELEDNYNKKKLSSFVDLEKYKTMERMDNLMEKLYDDKRKIQALIEALGERKSQYMKLNNRNIILD